MCRLQLCLLFAFTLIVHITYGQNKSIQLIHANKLQYDESKKGKVRMLIGDVEMVQENTRLYCDSAYQYETENKVEAYGNVRINHNDSIQFTGRRLTYWSDTRTAFLEKSVTMKDRQTTLLTERLDFDLASNKGYYTRGGKIISDENTLTSTVGYYYANEKLLFFKSNVVLISPQYTIYTDTLKYHTETKVAYFNGPTQMYGKKDTLYCELGNYDTKNEKANLFKKASVSNPDITLKADSVYYTKPIEYGKARGKVYLLDKKNRSILFGEHGEMLGLKKQFIMTHNAVIKQYSSKDSMYVFADTIQYFQNFFGQKEMAKCFHNVKLLKSDVQAVCDSLVYTKYDSTIYLYTGPVVWSGQNQITADTILLFTNNNTLDSFCLLGNGFLASREGAKEFNQLVGRKMYGTLLENKLDKIYAEGNAQSIYYARDDKDSTYLGVNVISCSEMEFYFKDNKISHSNFITKPDAIFYPLGKLKPEELRLKGFRWRHKLRPNATIILPIYQVKYKDL